MKNIKIFQFRMPEEIHDWLRTKSFNEKISMNKIILESIQKTKEKEQNQNKT